MSLHRTCHRLCAWPPVAPLHRVEVVGDSMAPQLRPGDRLLVTSLVPIRRGDVVALRDPRDRGRVLVKRVAAVLDAERRVVVLGDNRAASTDSRSFGPVPVRLLLGRCVWRYHPPSRRGGLAPGDRSQSDCDQGP
jgi:nickel-type superoxide dismutase maturation protease